MKKVDAIIIGGGPAGLAAAIELHKNGITDILILEREKQMGGILRQCIHDGFGLTRFKTTLSGPEYAQRFIDEVIKLNIPYKTDTTVLEIADDQTNTYNKIITAVSKDGLIQYQAKAVILTMGCRERTRGALAIPGERPAGVFTAGVAQAYMNLYNRMPGKEIVILGSGDIGMIMARRFTLEGAHVQAVLEIQPVPSGLPRNIQQCLNDYEIPLYLNHTVTEIHGNARLTGVTVANVDEHLKPITGTEQYYSCDTLILSVGLIPENELSIDAGVILDQRTKGAIVDEHFQTNVEGLFAAGNVLHVHDLVDFVSMEAEKLAESAAVYIKEGKLPKCSIEIKTDHNIGHTIPQKISGNQDVNLSLRVKSLLKNCKIVICQNGVEIASRKMKKALPAEMIYIPIKANKIKTMDYLEVKVEC
jgi:thioredoxin reductase